MLTKILISLGWIVLGFIGLLLFIGTVIAIFALITYWKIYRDYNRKEGKLKKNNRGFFGKLHDVGVMAFWVVISAIWYIIICIIGFFGICYDCILACFKQKN